MNHTEMKNIIEVVLMVSSRPLSIAAMRALFRKEGIPEPEISEVRSAIEALRQDYEQRGVELVEVAGGFRFQARNDYASWVNHLFVERPSRYSRALLETLAIIAYRQPVTRSEIEEIRGVSVGSNIIRTLRERDWIKHVGHRDVPGHPALFATTKSFLDYFNLKRLSDLPPLAGIRDIDSVGADLFEGMEADQAAGKTDPPATEETSSDMPPQDDIAETVSSEPQGWDDLEEEALSKAMQYQDDVAETKTSETEIFVVRDDSNISAQTD